MAATAVFQAVTSALNAAGNAIKAQAAIIAGQLSVNQSGTAYHQNVDYALFQYSLGQQQQETILIGILVVAIVLFLLMVLFIK